MHREVFALLYNDNKDAPPLLPTETGTFIILLLNYIYIYFSNFQKQKMDSYSL